MDYEKKYKEALERARKSHDNAHGLIKKEWVETIFPELKESENERIRKTLSKLVNDTNGEGFWNYYKVHKEEALAWLEKQGKACKIAWHGISKEPREQEELLCEWDSDDATWHDIVFYHADTKTFWNGELEIENVVRWAYLNEMLEPQGEIQKPNFREKYNNITNSEWFKETYEDKSFSADYNKENNKGNCEIDGLHCAKTILEKTLGKVEGYQSDDGILEHKSAINAVTKLCDEISVTVDD